MDQLLIWKEEKKYFVKSDSGKNKCIVNNGQSSCSTQHNEHCFTNIYKHFNSINCFIYHLDKINILL